MTVMIAVMGLQDNASSVHKPSVSTPPALFNTLKLEGTTPNKSSSSTETTRLL